MMPQHVFYFMVLRTVFSYWAVLIQAIFVCYSIYHSITCVVAVGIWSSNSSLYLLSQGNENN